MTISYKITLEDKLFCLQFLNTKIFIVIVNFKNSLLKVKIRK